MSESKGPNGWDEYGRLVLSKLDEHDESLKENTKAIEKLSGVLYDFRARVYTWATIVAALVAIAVRLIPNPWS